jgi:hypothetical protein
MTSRCRCTLPVGSLFGPVRLSRSQNGQSGNYGLDPAGLQLGNDLGLYLV